MKIYISMLAVAMFFIACETGVQQKKEEGTVDTITKEEALELLHKWTNAYLEGTADVLDEVLDDSWVYSGSADGTTTNKTSTILEFSNADYSFDAIEYQNLDVRLYNDIAVVRGRERMVILDSSKQDTTVLKLRFTDVYQKKEGKVRAISTHSSPIE